MPEFKKLLSTWCLFCLHFSLLSQTDAVPVVRIDFNEHEIKEINDRITLKPVGLSLTYDRFGNKESALQTQGIATSYLNLGSSSLIKQKTTTIAMWVRILGRVYAGKGYEANPFLIMRRDTGEDFNIAYCISYNPPYNKIGAWASKDSIHEVSASCRDTVVFNTWYHVVVTSDYNYFTLYVDGREHSRSIKNYETTFAEGDSVLIGRSLGRKNLRYCIAVFDDICFYDRVLSPEEIKALYNEPNPNRFKDLLDEALKYGIIVLVLGAVILILMIRNKRNIKKQKEYYEMNNKIMELELKVIKTQMNPHFISNNLAAIQDLIYKNEVEKAGQYLAKFSFFLREVLDYSDRTFSTLEDELNLIRLTVELEQMRFKNDFRFQVNIQEGLQIHDIAIPSLITQPFIENAIWHGLLPLKDRAPELRVNIYRKDQSIFLEICDNGVGRLAAKKMHGKNSKGISLSMEKIQNINRLVNRADYRLQIEDLFDGGGNASGTKIVIEITSNSQEE